MALHSKLEHEYAKTKATIPILKYLLEREHASLCKHTTLVGTHRTNICELNERISDLHHNYTYGNFRQEAEHCIGEYRQAGTTRTEISFTKVDGDTQFSSDYGNSRRVHQGGENNEWSVVAVRSKTAKLKLCLVEEYIDIASKYAYITIIKACTPSNSIHHCYSCEMELDQQGQSTPGLLVCPKCHTENPATFNNVVSREDAAHVQVKDDSIHQQL